MAVLLGIVWALSTATPAGSRVIAAVFMVALTVRTVRRIHNEPWRFTRAV